MIRRWIPVLFLASCSSPPPPVSLADHVRDITDDRPKAAGVVASRFAVLGIETVDQIREIHGETVRNVIGRIGNPDGEAVILGAHHDAVEGSPGADDNASGIAVLLEIAERLVRRPPDRTVLLIAFGGEEQGTLGSTWYTRNPLIPLDRTVAMINLDMVGRLKGTLAAIGVDSAEEWDDLLDRSTPHGLTLKRGKGGVGPSDHTPFYLAGIPVLHLFTGAHEDYHKKTDTPDKLNYEGMKLVADFVEALIRNAADADRLTYRKSSVEVKPVTEGGEHRARPYLGLIPDYTYEGEGVRLNGVNGGSPAEKAGLKEGDVIYSFNAQLVADINEYSRLFFRTKPGDELELKILRGKGDFPVKVRVVEKPE